VARGWGAAQEVWPEDWTEYKKWMQSARDELVTNKDIASLDPAYFWVLAGIEFELGGKHADIIKRAEEAKTAFPNYPFPFPRLARYFGYAWGGSEELYEAWTTQALAAEKGTASTAQLARIHWATAGGFYQYEDVKDEGPGWPRLRKAYADSVEQFPNFENVTRSIFVACTAADMTEVQRLLSVAKVRVGPGMSETYAVPPPRYCGVLLANQ
jgi:hypothetical protein